MASLRLYIIDIQRTLTYIMQTKTFICMRLIPINRLTALIKIRKSYLKILLNVIFCKSKNEYPFYIMYITV